VETPHGSLTAASEKAASSNTVPKTFDEITKLCGHDGLDGTKPRRGIFDELVKANAAVSQTLLFTTHDESPETGYGNTHKYSLFLALSRFDITLQQCGFHSFPKVPMELSTIDGIDSQDCSFKRLQTDIVGYLRFCGTFIYDSAPYIRDMLQLTGYAGSNLRKFKSVETTPQKGGSQAFPGRTIWVV